MENMNTETPVVVASNSLFSTVLKHPVTRVTGIVASYVGTAVAGWYFGKKVEAAYAKRAARAEAESVYAEQVRHSASQRNEHHAQA